MPLSRKVSRHSKPSKGGAPPVIFIFDQLEQIRGSASNETEVIASVERLFASHLDKLKLPLTHAIYTVPPWLPFALHGQQIEILPSLRLWNNDAGRTRVSIVWDAVRCLINRRLQEGGLERLFADRLLSADKLIEASGGQFRDLLRLIQEVVTRVATLTRTLPASQEVVHAAIQRIREQYLPISEEDALILAEIAAHRGAGLRSSDGKEISRNSRMLNEHLVLYFSNGGEYYDVHPLVREEVDKIVRRLKAKQTAPQLETIK